MPLVPTPKQCDPSVKKAIQILTQKLGLKSVPTFTGLTLSAGPLDLSGKLTVGSFASPIDVTNTREYGFEIHYSGNDYNATAIRARAHAVTTDTSAQFQGGLFQAANNDNINVGVLNGLVAEAIGKATTNAATITMMRGALIGAEWSAKDTVTDLRTLHVRTHTRDAATEGYVSGTGYGIYLENEAVGGSGQALDAGIYFKGTNLSAGNKAFTYGIDFTGGTYGTSQINLIAAGSITMVGTQVIKFDDTNFNVLFGSDAFQNDNGQSNVGLGYQAGYNNDTTGAGDQGDFNVYIGYRAGYGATGGSNNTGYHNVGIGNNALYKNTTGYKNVAMGYQALYSNTTGTGNFALGDHTLLNNTTAGHNVAIGTLALTMANVNNNIAIGSNTLRNTTSGGNNTVIGMSAANKNITGKNNTAIGSFSMYYTTAGDENVTIGQTAGLGVSGNSYSDNVFIGFASGLSTTTGSQNIYLGYKAGYRQTDNSNRLIIDNRDRGSAATELTNAILYGVMAATPASQTLRINATLTLAGNLVMPDGGTIGQADGPLLRFDDANNFLEITGCKVGFGTQTPYTQCHVKVSTDGDGITIQRNSASADTYADLKFLMTTTDAETAQSYIRVYRRTGFTDNDMLFHVGGTDVLYLDDNGNVGVGTKTQVSLLEADGALGLAIETVTGDTTLDTTHSTVLVNASGNVTITLPTAASAYNNTDGIGRIYEIKKIDADADTVTIDGNASETIDGGLTAILTVQYESITIQSDGSNWHII